METQVNDAESVTTTVCCYFARKTLKITEKEKYFTLIHFTWCFVVRRCQYTNVIRARDRKEKNNNNTTKWKINILEYVWCIWMFFLHFFFWNIRKKKQNENRANQNVLLQDTFLNYTNLQMKNVDDDNEQRHQRIKGIQEKMIEFI